MSDSRWIVPLSDLTVDDEMQSAVREAVASAWWSMGPRVEEFESAFAQMCEARHAVAVANGTAALHLALIACGCGPGDEVILPSLNFVAAANVIGHVGATPVFCDINSTEDLNLDPADVEAAVGPRTKALLVLHYGGFACDMARVLEIADRHELLVIEDAAHAPNAEWQGRKCGSIGDVGCFSFFSNKNLPIGEGGSVVTDDDEIAAKLRLLRSHGMTTLTWDRHRGHAHSYDVVEQGFNYRLDEVRAAMALVQLRRLPFANERRAQLAARYRERLHGVGGIAMPFPDSDAQRSSAHHLAVIVLPPSVSRDGVRSFLADRRIQTSMHYPPIHGFSLYAAKSARALPVTEDVANRLITLPLYPSLRDDQVDLVIDAVLDAVDEEHVGAAASERAV